jgi:glyoxylase I family protein
LNGEYSVELLSFSIREKTFKSQKRFTSCGFEVNNIEQTRNFLVNNDITSEGIRVDEFTGKRFSLLQIDDLLMEFYE